LNVAATLGLDAAAVRRRVLDEAERPPVRARRAA
jgi:hypothetical protein